MITVFTKRLFSLFPIKEHLSTTLNFTIFLLFLHFLFCGLLLESSLVFKTVVTIPRGITCCVIGIRPLSFIVATYLRKVASFIQLYNFNIVFFSS